MVKLSQNDLYPATITSSAYLSIFSILKGTDKFLSKHSWSLDKKIKYTFICQNCGKTVTKFVHKRNSHGKTRKKYCSNKCKNLYLNEQCRLRKQRERLNKGLLRKQGMGRGKVCNE